MVEKYEALLDSFKDVTTDARNAIDHASLTFQRERAFVQNSLAGALEERGREVSAIPEGKPEPFYDRAFELYKMLCQERTHTERDTRDYSIQYNKNLGKFLLEVRKDAIGARPHLELAYDRCCENEGPEVHLKLTQIPINA